MGLLVIFILSVCTLTPSLASESTYLEPNDFLAQAFPEQVPEPQLLWLTGQRKSIVTDILQHKPGFLRIRYWQAGNRSAWILDEIGKDKPITTGVVIDNGQIERVRVLVFRESRGWEVKYAFFHEQFDGLQLDAKRYLNQGIDNITGATLSVRAVTKQARLALLFDQWIRN